MIATAIDRLEYLCAAIPPLLLQIDEETFSRKERPDKWSKKEILGHLIDSATNNHQRFVRGQFEDNPAIVYDQDKWNEYNFHQQTDPRQLIDFWTIYNKQLLFLVKHISQEHLQRTCLVGGSFLTLDFLINDYVGHLEHHLRQIVVY